MRNRGPRERSVLSGSRSSFSGPASADCLYVDDERIVLSSPLTSHPLSRNSTASQSMSSGFDGGSPCAPKSSLVRTMPVPNSCCQNRLTATRAVSGFESAMSQLARSRRLIEPDAVVIDGRKPGVAAGTLSRRWSYIPRKRMCASAGLSSCSCMTCVTAPRRRTSRISRSSVLRRPEAGAVALVVDVQVVQAENSLLLGAPGGRAPSSVQLRWPASWR